MLVVARGFVPTYTSKHIDPEAGDVPFALKPHDLDRRQPGRVLRGRVVNENGDPVARVIVEPEGVKRGEGGQFGGLDELGIDPLAVTEDDGTFRLGVGQDGDALYLLIKAPFLAPVKTEPLAAGPTAHTITLGVGVMVSGRVVKGGKPLANAEVGMVQVDRGVTSYLGHFEFATDRDGRFNFVNIPPNQKWYLYGLMDSLKGAGSIRIRSVMSEGHGSTVDLDQIEVESGRRLSGRLVLSDGKPLPPSTRVILSREQAWDFQMVTAAPDGRFSFLDLPLEPMSLSTNIRGYHPSAKNRSLDPIMPSQLIGTVQNDVDDLLFLVDPGPLPSVDYGHLSREIYAERQRRQAGPHQGAASANTQ